MERLKIEKGAKFGNLTVLKELGVLGTMKTGHVYYEVLCDCGKIEKTRATQLKQGVKTMCTECYKKAAKNYKHGETGKRLYRIWSHMKARCNNPTDENYFRYGGRGITVCEEWNKSYSNFKNWAFENGYSSNLSIDRINVNGNYEPQNCRWADSFTQMNNTRANRKIEIDGRTQTLEQWKRELNKGRTYIINHFVKKKTRCEK